MEDEYHGSVLNKILSDPDVQQHEFVHFYQKELVDLKGEMELVKDRSAAIGTGGIYRYGGCLCWPSTF